MRVRLGVVGVMALLFSVRCGSHYRPTESATSDRPAAPLGRVFDVDLALPQLQVDAQGHLGATLEVELRLETAGPGRQTARYRFGAATAAGRAATAVDLSPGETFIVEGNGRFESGRIGPLKIGETAFELMLRGTIDAAGWHGTGSAWESQSGREGSFVVARRHRFLVTESDFSFVGSVALVEVRRGRQLVVNEDLTSASSDPGLRRSGGAVFVINRLSFDNLQRLDPQARFVTAWQASVGLGANPHDLLWVAAEKLYVTRYEPPFNDVLIASIRGGSSLGSIDLRGLAENRDQTPRADQIALAGGSVFVGLQDIDRTFTRYSAAKLAVIDPQLDQVVGSIVLPGKNPGVLRPLVGSDGRPRLYVALAGIFPGLLPQELSGGIAVVDVNNRAFERWALDDDQVGGNIGGFALPRHDLAYVVTSDREFHQRVVAFDPERARVLRTVSETSEFVPEIETDSAGLLAVPDRSFTQPRLCLFEIPAAADVAETLLGCAPLAAPPFAVEALD